MKIKRARNTPRVPFASLQPGDVFHYHAAQDSHWIKLQPFGPEGATAAYLENGLSTVFPEGNLVTPIAGTFVEDGVE